MTSEHKITDPAIIELLATNPEPAKKKKQSAPATTTGTSDSKMDTS